MCVWLLGGERVCVDCEISPLVYKFRSGNKFAIRIIIYFAKSALERGFLQIIWKAFSHIASSAHRTYMYRTTYAARRERTLAIHFHVSHSMSPCRQLNWMPSKMTLAQALALAGQSNFVCFALLKIQNAIPMCMYVYVYWQERQFENDKFRIVRNRHGNQVNVQQVRHENMRLSKLNNSSRTVVRLAWQIPS